MVDIAASKNDHADSKLSRRKQKIVDIVIPQGAEGKDCAGKQKPDGYFLPERALAG